MRRSSSALLGKRNVNCLSLGDVGIRVNLAFGKREFGENVAHQGVVVDLAVGSNHFV